MTFTDMTASAAPEDLAAAFRIARGQRDHALDEVDQLRRDVTHWMGIAEMYSRDYLAPILAALDLTPEAEPAAVLAAIRDRTADRKWGVRWPDGSVVGCRTEQRARDYAHTCGHELVTRLATDWQPATNGDRR